MIASSCKTEFDDIKHNNGNADLSRVVAVGGSHLAGYMDKALYREAQSNSIPAILSTRFSFVEGGIFLQPLVKPGVGIGIAGNAKYELRNIPDPCNSGMILLTQPVASAGDSSNYNWLGNFLVYNNLSVPNTRIGDLTRQSFGDPSPFLGNPLYARFASMPGTSTISGDALLINPSFVIVWMVPVGRKCTSVKIFSRIIYSIKKNSFIQGFIKRIHIANSKTVAGCAGCYD